MQRWAIEHPWPFAALVGLIAGIVRGVLQIEVQGRPLLLSLPDALTWAVLFFVVWGVLGWWRRRAVRK